VIKEAPRKRVILFVDTGDNCRCPMAKEYLKKLLAERNITWIEIQTAGVMTPNGLLPTPEAVQMVREEGWDTLVMEKTHRSRPLKPELIERADLILGMTPFHVQTAFRLSESARGKTFLLKEYTGHEGRNVQIPDPMGGTLEIFKKVFGQIKTCLNRLVEMDIITQCPYPPELMQAAEVSGTAADEEEEAAVESAAETAAGTTTTQKAPSKAGGKKPAPPKPPGKKPVAAKPAKPKVAVAAKKPDDKGIKKPVAKAKPARGAAVKAKPGSEKVKPAPAKPKTRPATKAATAPKSKSLPKKAKPAPKPSKTPAKKAKAKAAPKPAKTAAKTAKPAAKKPSRKVVVAKAAKPAAKKSVSKSATRKTVSKSAAGGKKSSKSTNKKTR
jgi:protein-tyrosine-phosphatase